VKPERAKSLLLAPSTDDQIDTFTGATHQRLGRFDGGTLFLDEAGELPSETQVALLRVLQDHEFERVGGTRRTHADLRVIAATNRDLNAAIGAGSFP
jgi:transcriptional regulator with GAF, ATPase, and Fis domain